MFEVTSPNGISVNTHPINLDQIDRLTSIIAKHFKNGDVVALNGEMGAGKTTLLSSIAKHLHLQKGQNVSSPTYVIHHIYKADVLIHHLDLYRLNRIEEVEELGFEEFLGKEGVTFIEWLANFPTLWSGTTLQIDIEIENLDQRRYTFSVTGNIPAHWNQLLETLKNSNL